ncbi:MFS transporter [uncultured Bacteroides sp.]|uniref:MFS transporter n=1 Tax=uncultured Bacteroides sp. TaxID=162156 RepID=UPI002AA79B34|nr:MFS transporter [uncultured Bacteroides sp.]
MKKSSTNKLLSPNYSHICFGNFLLFVSRYMLLPVLPSVMANRLGVSLAFTGSMFIFLTAAMFMVGPFYSYLVDAYKRKHVCVLSILMMLLATVGFTLVTTTREFLLLCLIHGAAFGMATTSGITLAIDLINPHCRSASNVVFGWTSRLGMMTGVALGVALFMLKGFNTVIYISVASGGLGILFIYMLYVPFRAPIGTKFCTTDRFLLARGWVPLLNMLFIAFVPGILIPLIPYTFRCVEIAGIIFPFFAVMGAGFFCSVLFVKLFFEKENILGQIVSGLVAMIVAISLLIFPIPGLGMIPAAALLGIGLGLVTPEFLLMFVKLSQHCQRGTANTTHLLAWEAGVSLGVVAACYLTAHVGASPVVPYRMGLASALIALAFFVFITYPYFKKKKIR